MAEPMRETPWTPADSLAIRLRTIRYELGYTVEQMAEKCGFNDKTYSSWENGARPRDRAEVVAQIAQATGVDPIWLMWGQAGPEGSTSRYLDDPADLLVCAS